MSELPAGPGWYEDEHDPLLLRYFDGVVWTSHTTPRRSPTAAASTIGRATPGVIPGRAGNPGAWAQPGPQDQQGQGSQGQWQGGGMPPAGQNPYQQAWATQRAGVLPDGEVLAEWWRRLVGRILDVIVTVVITMIIAFPWLSKAVSTMSDFIAKTMQAAQNGGTAPSQAAFADQFYKVVLPITLISIVVSLVYETAFLTTRGATPGKMVMGTLVRPVAGPGRISVVTALRRQVISVATSLMGLVPLLSIFGSMLQILDPAWLLWDPKRQCLHDKVAETVVVLRNPNR